MRARTVTLALFGLQFATHVFSLTPGSPCSVSPVVPNAVGGFDCVSGGPVADQDTCDISCASGYAPTTQTATCKDGIWSAVPVCRPTGATADCAALPVLPVLGTPSSFSCSAPAAHGVECSFTCSEGFSATGAFKCFDSVWSVESCQLARFTPSVPSATGAALEGAGAAASFGTTSPVALIRTGADTLDSTASSLFADGVDLVAALASLVLLPGASLPTVGSPSLLLDDDTKASISFAGAPDLYRVPATDALAVNGPALIDGYALAAALRSMGAATTSPAPALGSLLGLPASAALSFGDADDVWVAPSGTSELSFSGRLLVQGRDLVALAKAGAAGFLQANAPATTPPAQPTVPGPDFGDPALLTPLTVVANREQTTSGSYLASKAIDGIAREADGTNGWAYNAVFPSHIVFGLGDTPIPVVGIWILTGVGFAVTHLNDFTIEYTAESSPGLASSFSPVANIVPIGSAPGFSSTGNHITVTGQELLFLQFDRVEATGFRIDAFGSDAPNDNSVLTEVRVLLNTPLTFTTPFSADSALHHPAFPASEAVDAVSGLSHNGWSHPGAVDPFVIFRATELETPSVVSGMRIYNGQDRPDYETLQFAIEFTTDATPTLNGAWTALPDTAYFIGQRLGSISGDTFNSDGTNVFEVMWDPILATGIKFRSILATTVDGNIVLNEVELLTANGPTITTPPPSTTPDELFTPLTAVANRAQNGFPASASIDGIALEADLNNGWAYNGVLPSHIVFGLGTTRPVVGIWLLSGVGRIDHHLNDFTVEFTTDSSPGLASSFSPVANIVPINAVAGFSSTGNHVTVTGQELLFLQFDLVQATGLRINSLGTDAANDNVVLTEFRVLLDAL